MKARESLDLVAGLLGLDTVPDYHVGAADALATLEQCVEACEWITEGVADGETVYGPKVAHGIAEACAALEGKVKK